MVYKCCIKGCNSRKYPESEMSFHGFPKDRRLFAKWIKLTKIKGNVKYKRICALHFKYEDFIIKGRLKPKVLPAFLRPPFKTYPNDNKIVCKPTNDNCMTDIEQHDENGKIDDIDLDISDIAELREITDNLRIDIQFENNDVTDGFERCKCCLENNRLKSMWQVNCNGELCEVYGSMLIECFALPWSIPADPEGSQELICESCIMRLRDAVGFKTVVLASQRLLTGPLVAEDTSKLNQDRDVMNASIQTEYLHYEVLLDTDDIEDGDNMNDNSEEINTESNEVQPIITESLTTSHQSIAACNIDNSSEMNQEEMTLSNKKQPMEVMRKLDTVTTRSLSQSTALKRFRYRKTLANTTKNEDDLLPSNNRFTETQRADVENLTENIRKSTEAVQSEKLTEAKAAMVYSVPRKLISKKVRKVSKNDGDDDTLEPGPDIKNDVENIKEQKNIDDDSDDSKKTIREIKNEIINKKVKTRVIQKKLGVHRKSNENRLTEMKKQANNIAVILESTNATPIRRHGGIGYGCCFCEEDFPDAADLKQHTIKEHDIKTKRNFTKGKRPSAYLVKLDITGLICNLCGNAIDSLVQLYDHLVEFHKKLIYRDAKDYIVPFKFEQDELRCLFCEFICNSFKGLLEHMSVHYRNHICEVCDAGFLTKNNLFNHAGRHKKGTFKCDYCPKVFDTSSKKAGHQRLVHSGTNGVNRCGYCGEKFGTYRRKEKHLITEHGVTLKKLKCKACDKTFETQTGLRIHTKRDHLIERRFKCAVCDKRCFTNVQLNQHSLKHTGIKTFQCGICLKAYGRKSTLREHLRIHENDRRFKCELCGMAFVQKCSWRGHMLSKHGQQV